MKLLVKILIALAFVGVTLLGIGILNGGELYTALQDGRLVALNSRFDSAATHGTATVTDPDTIDILHIEINGGSCEIEMGNELSCSNEIDMTAEDDTVIFTVNGGGAEITLPEKMFETVRIDISGGKLEADRLNASSCVINMNGGAAEIDQIWARSALIHEQLGNIEIEQLDVESDCQLVTMAGNLDIEDLYAVNVEAICKGGSMALGLPYEPVTYYCTAAVSAGSCTWDGGALENAGFGGTDAENILDLTVSAGAVDLYRAEKD